MKFSVFNILLITICVFNVNAQIICNAGIDFTVCPNITYTLGGSPSVSGGLAPYSYTWSPSSDLSNANAANPILNNCQHPYYVLFAEDSLKARCIDTVYVKRDSSYLTGAGNNIFVCIGTASAYTLGATTNTLCNTCVFNWTPSTGLNNPSLPNPVTTPTNSISYTLHVTSGGCSLQNTININFGIQTLTVNPQDTTIEEGNVVTLHVFGATNYTWYPNNNLLYMFTDQPDVWPKSTTTYTVYSNTNGCLGIATVTVHVIPSDNLVFYNTFTPNGDLANDFFYIGNLEKYPDNSLTIYNRYGQKIYFSRGYKNDWDGKISGDLVPTGTYFYVLDTGTDKGSYKGSVTIIR